MENLFLKRATEHLRDHEAFLAVVSPEPLRYFLAPAGARGLLYDRLVLLQGTPGSGKTTLASLFEFPRLSTLLKNTSLSGHAVLVAALAEAGAVLDGDPTVLGCRLPLETDYRDIWEFPYQEELRLAFTASLIQARAVLAWTKNLESCRVPFDSVRLIPRSTAAASVEAVGGTTLAGLYERAKEVERSLYRIVGALVPPALSDIDPRATDAYSPFDVFEHFEIERDGEPPLRLTPLAILDDAQWLHPDQFAGVRRWLAKREMRVARWMVHRLDILNATEALAAVTEEHSGEPPLPGIGPARDIHTIVLQAPEDRKQMRPAFRRMARDMAHRYLQQMPLFARRSLVKMPDLLLADVDELPRAYLEKVAARVDAAQRLLGIAPGRRTALEATITEYANGATKSVPKDVHLAMLHVLMHRFAKRTPQRKLFDVQEVDGDPARPITADIGVADGARLWLFHEYDRPYYYGMDDLCDASSQNAEQFLHLAAGFVESIANQLIRSKPPSLTVKAQHKYLTRKAVEIINDWEFPHFAAVRGLADAIAGKCLTASLAPNAWLDAGANAYAVPQREFDDIPRSHPRLAQILQFGIAYNAFALVPRYKCKDQLWCLIELGGIVSVAHGLTLKRGGFLEGDSTSLSQILDEVAR